MGKTGDAPPAVGVAVLAYEAEVTIEAVLDQIPRSLLGPSTRVLVVDDASSDGTGARASAWVDARGAEGVDVLVRPVNLGYGGNQKACMRWAIADGLDVLAFVHGDGQHPTRLLPRLVAPVVEDGADLCSGSRLAERGAARRGGMPLGRWLGNRALAHLQNAVAGTEVSDWHSGFRAYRVGTLAELDLDALTDGFAFDAEMVFALLDHGSRIVELPVPTHYGQESSRAPLLPTGVRLVRNAAVQGFRRRRS